MNIANIIDRTLYLQDTDGIMYRVFGYDPDEETVILYCDDEQDDHCGEEHTYTFDDIRENINEMKFFELKQIEIAG